MKAEKNNSVKWLYTLDQNDERTFLIPFSELEKLWFGFFPRNHFYENDWITIETNQTFIEIRMKKEGYSWDGCSPKFNIYDMIFGTSDGVVDKRSGKPKAFYASMIHDVLYQFTDHGFTRKQVDIIFLYLMKEYDFRPAKLYYHAVRTFGGMFTEMEQK